VRKKEASFWSDIKTLDERLAKDPDSYCFARLSEVYLKVGLVSDALHTARKGVARHPGYIAGQRSLAMACHASGLHDECLNTLVQVTAAMPEDVDALKILAHLYAEKGDDDAAIRTYRTLLEFKPEDIESTTQLEALLKGGDTVSRSYVDDDLDVTDFKTPLEQGDSEDEFEADEEIHELNESDIVYDDLIEDEPVAAVAETQTPASEHHDPLSTVTLAELYVQQGFVAKALDIYRSILVDDPANEQVRAKISQLEGSEPCLETEQDQDLPSPVSEEYEFESEETVSFEQNEPPPTFELAAPEPEPEAAPAPVFSAAPPVFEFQEEPEAPAPAVLEAVAAPVEPSPFAPLQNQTADNVVNTLDGWLDNIRRIKACR
jgi:tetratricopeptide (TPR) repeat protein